MPSVKPEDAGGHTYIVIYCHQVSVIYCHRHRHDHHHYHHEPNTGVYACVGENSEGSSRQEVLLTVFCELTVMKMMLMMMMIILMMTMMMMMMIIMRLTCLQTEIKPLQIKLQLLQMEALYLYLYLYLHVYLFSNTFDCGTV